MYMRVGLQHEVSVESGAAPDSPGAEEAGEEGGEMSTKKPGLVALPEDMTAMQIDCGTFHTGMYTTHLYVRTYSSCITETGLHKPCMQYWLCDATTLLEVTKQLTCMKYFQPQM